MSRTININSVDRASVIRLPSFLFTECAINGEIGVGGFNVDDTGASLSIPALKAVTVDESAASPVRLFTGYTQDRTTQRGPGKVAGQREWDVEVVDINVLATDYIMSGSDANRGEETDYARITWLLTTRFNTVGGVSAGVVPNSNTVTMDASDYRGKAAADVLAECAEAAGKLWFIYRHSSGPLLYYDLATGTSLRSTTRFSDVASDVDNSTTWGLASPPKVKTSPDRIFSTIHFKYKRGTVTVTNATTATNYRTRETYIEDTSVKTSAKATNKANKFLASAATELVEISELEVDLPAANVNDVRAGHGVQIKLTRHGISSFTYYRVTRRIVTPSPGVGGGYSDVRYRVRFTLASDILPMAVGGRGQGYTPGEQTNGDDTNDATVVIDSSGITITGGSITVTNPGGTVIIDGTSDMWRIAATGTMTVPLNSTKGDVFKTVDVNTGITSGTPYSMWAVASESDSSFYQPTPEVLYNLSGQILRYFTGMAKNVGGGVTRVRGLKGTTHPPLSARTFKYWVMQQVAF